MQQTSSPRLRPQCRAIKFQLLNIPVISCYLSYLATMGSHSVTEMKINGGKDVKFCRLFLVLPQLQCGIHKALFRSDCAFSRSFLRESYSGSLTRQTCSLSLSVSLFCGHRDSWACESDRKDLQPTSESFPLSCQSTGQPPRSGLTPL